MIPTCTRILVTMLTNMRSVTYKLITSLAKLEVGCRRRKLVDQLIDHVAKTRILVSLEVCLQVIFRKALVDLVSCQFSVNIYEADDTYLCKWVFLLRILISQLNYISAPVERDNRKDLLPMTC